MIRHRIAAPDSLHYPARSGEMRIFPIVEAAPEPQAGPEAVDGGRRSLLRAGLFGSVLLGAAGVTAGLSGCARREDAAAAGYKFLRDADLPLLHALVPGVLGALLPSAGAERDRLLDDLLHRIDLSAYRLGHPARKALAQLFDLLNLRLSRQALTGIAHWEQATPAQLQAFLERWRMIKLVSGAFYGTPAGWSAANYPGPPPGPYQVFNS
jgi:hypothetical protein